MSSFTSGFTSGQFIRRQISTPTLPHRVERCSDAVLGVVPTCGGTVGQG